MEETEKMLELAQRENVIKQQRARFLALAQSICELKNQLMKQRETLATFESK